MSYSKDLRERALAYRASGHTWAETQATFGVAVSTVQAWEKRLKETGSLEVRNPERRHKKVDPKELLRYVEEHPDAYLREIAEEFSCTEAAIRKALKRLQITRKKRQPTIESKTLKK
jgi:transposase